MASLDISRDDLLAAIVDAGSNTQTVNGTLCRLWQNFSHLAGTLTGADTLTINYAGFNAIAGFKIYIDGADVTPTLLNDGANHSDVVRDDLDPGTTYDVQMRMDGCYSFEDAIFTIEGPSAPSLVVPAGYGTILYPNDNLAAIGTDLDFELGTSQGGIRTVAGFGITRFRASMSELWAYAYGSEPFQLFDGDGFQPLATSPGNSFFAWHKVADGLNTGLREMQLLMLGYTGPFRFVGGTGFDATYAPADRTAYADAFYGDSIVGGYALSPIITLGHRYCVHKGTTPFISTSPAQPVYTYLRDNTANITELATDPTRLWIYAGTNDKGSAISQVNFAPAYQEMVENIRTAYPSTVIYCLGLWTENASGAYNLSIQAAVAAIADVGVLYVDTSDPEVWPSEESDFLPDEVHLSEQGAEKVGAALFAITDPSPAPSGNAVQKLSLGLRLGL